MLVNSSSFSSVEEINGILFKDLKDFSFKESDHEEVEIFSEVLSG